MAERFRSAWWRRGALVVLLLGVVFVAGTAAAPDGCRDVPSTCGRIAFHRYIEPLYSADETEPADIKGRVEGHDLDFYGIQYVPTSQFDVALDLNADATLQDFAIDADPAEWLAQLDAAEADGLSVVAWQWPPGWTWDDDSSSWAMDPRAVEFLETVEGHPALLAVYGTHEAYWNGCFGCGYTTAQLQQLYSQIKAIADVPVYSSFDGFDFWREAGPETTFAPGICDYCDTWYYPVLADGTYDRDEYINRLHTELATVRELDPNAKFVWVLQSFASAEAGRSLPNATQLQDMVALAAEADIDGIWWYPWEFDAEQYEEVLGDHPELHDAVRNGVAGFESGATGDDRTGDDRAVELDEVEAG